MTVPPNADYGAGAYEADTQLALDIAEWMDDTLSPLEDTVLDAWSLIEHLRRKGYALRPNDGARA